MAVSFHKYIDRLNRSGLLTTQQLQTLLAAAPRDQRPGDAASLSRWLVRESHLTPFQAKAIYLGRTKGLIVGNYVILDLLGVGGMGQVYKAEHRRMKRTVALKLLSPKVARKPKLVRRFHQEVQAAARLMHPNIVTAFDADEAGGKHFLVMEYVPGRDLASLVRERGRLSVDRSIRCVLDAARGLEYAHSLGVVHRDVKPSNLLLTSTHSDSVHDDAHSTCVKILDMGLARIEAEAESLHSSDLTRTGIVMGTVDYMSPEQAVNTHDADHRSDIYSLGITLHYLITGSVPFQGRTVIEQILAHREKEIPFLHQSRSEVPAALDSIFRRMVAKQPGDRYQSMGEVVTALEGVLNTAESATDLPILLDESSGDDALASFLDSMSGDPVSKRQAAAAIITPASTALASETLVGSDQSTAVERLVRRRYRRNTIPWGAVLLHASWSLALLGAAIWMVWSTQNRSDSLPAPPAVNNSPTNPAAHETPQTTDDETNAEPTSGLDRRLAEWTLARGGTVTVADAVRSESVQPGQELPRWDFSLTTINLAGTVLDADQLPTLAESAQLLQLTTLRVPDAPLIDDRWLEALVPCHRLMHLDVRQTGLGDAGLATLPRVCPMLEGLTLDGCPISDAGLAALNDLPRLRQLSLTDTAITAGALPHLRGLTSLRELNLQQTAITPAQRQTLQQALPACTILPDGDTPAP